MSPAHAAPAPAAARRPEPTGRYIAIPKAGHIPERSCIACGRKAAKGELVRIVRTPDGAVMADATGRSNGRGAYLCRRALCWEKGLTKRVLERRLSAAVSSRNLAELRQHFVETFASAAAGRPR